MAEMGPLAGESWRPASAAWVIGQPNLSTGVPEKNICIWPANLLDQSEQSANKVIG